MKVLSSWDIVHNGETSEDKKLIGGIYQPIQMCSIEKKDQSWLEDNIDWYEDLGMKQLSITYPNTLKNYELAAGVIDKSDYIPSGNNKGDINDYNNISSTVVLDLTADDELPVAMELTFYPIIPNVIKVLLGEFSKRYQEVKIQAVDQFTKSEKLDLKFEKIKEYVVNVNKAKLFNQLIESGYEPSSEEELQQIQQQVDQQVMSLPQIQELFSKNYRSMVEQWAQHQILEDDQRFNMYEKENMAFADYLKQDKQFWHINLREDDYNVELWSPLNTFYHISKDKKYVSEGNFVGRTTVMSIADIIDNYREKLHEHDITVLEDIHYSVGGAGLPYGHQDHEWYDTSKPYTNQYPNDTNIQKRMTSMSMAGLSNFIPVGHDAKRTFSDYLNIDGDMYDYPTAVVTEVYWKSQKRMGYLTAIDDEGIVTSELVTESFKVTKPAIYDNKFYKNKSKKSLIYGEHIDWFWINEVYGGKKIDVSGLIGSTRSGTSNRLKRGSQNRNGEIYFDCGPIKFQFKSEDSLWEAKLPVEGIAKTDIRLPMGVSLVDLMKPYQIKYNIVNNQIKDLLIDEKGTVVMLDPKSIPTNSMGEDWGVGNLAKVSVAMDEFGILPIDTSLENMGARSNFSHFQMLNLEQSNRFLTRIQIADWCKREAFATVGITPERLGSVSAQQTATGVNQAVNNSYSQTEMYFVEHINFLMPRVRNMMVNAAQYYNATKPSVSLSYMNDNNENVMFEMEGYKLLTKDLQVYTNFKPNSRNILEQMKMLVMENNTTNATIYDLLKVLSASTPAEVVEIAKRSVEQFNKQQEQMNQQQSELMQQQQQGQLQDKEREREHETLENEKDRKKDIAVATIRALGYAEDSDIDQNLTPDILEISKFNENIGQFQEKMLLDREKVSLDRQKHSDNIQLEREKMLTDKEIKDKELQIARENQTRAELEAKNKLKSKSNTKK